MQKKSISALGFALASGALSQGIWGHGAAGNSERPALPAEQKPWGIGADEDQVDRELVIRMGDDMRFSPDHFEAEEGETLRLVIINEGQMRHELVLGTAQELGAHAAMMAKYPGMEHDEPYMAHVEPGQTQSMLWTFNRAGRFEFACLLPGHFQAGMLGSVQVNARPLSNQ